MKFEHISHFWYTDFRTKDISFGVHICWKGRIDIHFLFGMLSIGIVPIYSQQGKRIAVSNSFHQDKKLPIRAGVP